LAARDAARLNGADDDQQAATESAEAAWLKLARNEWEDQMISLIYRAQAGKVGPAAFDLTNLAREDLLWIAERVEKRPKSPSLTLLSEAIYREIAVRRRR
jgi:hypothetical protein